MSAESKPSNVSAPSPCPLPSACCLPSEPLADGIVGDVLFWAIRHCIGDGAYTYGVHGAWIKIYSRMLRSMVPVAVAYEMRNGNAQIKRFAGTTSNSSFIGASFLGLGMSSSSLLKSREETVVLPESACLKPEA